MQSELLEMVKREGIDILYWDFVKPLQAVYCSRPGMPPTIGLSLRYIDGNSNEMCSILAELLGVHFSTGEGTDEVTYPLHNGRILKRQLATI